MNSVLTPYNLHPANTKQLTRISRTTFSLLDYTITDKLINSQYITDTLLSSNHSGHFAVLGDVVTMKQKVRNEDQGDKKHNNVSQFNNADWKQIFSTNSVNQQLNIFSRIFYENLQNHAPRKIAIVRNPPIFEAKNASWFDEVSGQHWTRSKTRTENTDENPMQTD